MQNSSPVVASTVTIATGSLYGTIVAYFINLPDGVILCALIGATLYVLTNVNISWQRQVILFVISFLIGTTEAAQVMAQILTKLLTHIDVEYTVGAAAGALVVSACGVTFMLLLMHFVQAYTERKLNVIADTTAERDSGDAK